MELSFTQKKSIRKNFGKLKEGLSIPNLIEVQKNSYNEFLSSNSLDIQVEKLSKDNVEKMIEKSKNLLQNPEIKDKEKYILSYKINSLLEIN